MIVLQLKNVFHSKGNIEIDVFVLIEGENDELWETKVVMG
jgi:hypothetical protein